jgi:zinc-binding alcohol dehydrogenase/oxidoreductase
MKALLLASADGPDAALVTDVDAPEERAGEICVALRAASLNHRELWISRGMYPGLVLPTILGADGAGIVESVGAGADPALIGRDVLLYPALGWGDSEDFPGEQFGLLGMPGPGTIAERICVPAANAFARPDHLSAVQAASLPVAGLTAYRALLVKAGLRKGDRLLITGVGGGVAMFALLFAKALGATVFVTSGSDETLEMARLHGADGGFNYTDKQWGKALRKKVGGLDVVFDGAPAASFSHYARTLAMGARIILYGSTGGPSFTVSAPDLFLRHSSIIGTSMGSPKDFGAMLDFVSRHRIVPVIDREFVLDEAGHALRYLEHGNRSGKVVIRIE